MPVSMVAPMDDPDVSIQSDWEATAARRARALVSGERLTIAGHSFLVTAEGIGHARELARLVGGFGPGALPHAATFSLVVEAPPCPPRPADETYDGIELWRDGDRLVLRSTTGVCGWANRTNIVIGGSNGIRESLRHLFLPLAAHVLAHHDVFVIHGGAADAGNGALLFLGPSGAGKSTLAGLSLAKGWDVLGDDIVALTTHDDGLWVIGVPRPPAVPVDAAPKDAAGSEELDPRGRRHLDPGVLDTSAHQVIGTVLPFRATDGEDRCDRTAAPELLHHIIGSFTSATTRGLLARFLPVAAMLARCPGYALPLQNTGSDRLTAAADHLVAVESQLRLALR